MKKITFILQCSEQCGRGERHRAVVCVEVSSPLRSDWRIQRRWYPYGKRDRVKFLSNSDLVVADSKCDQNRKPKSVRGCHRMYCPYSWVEGEWSEVLLTSCIKMNVQIYLIPEMGKMSFEVFCNKFLKININK